MSKRVAPSERLRAEIDEVFAGGADLATAVEEVARIGARLLLQTAVEAEATEFLRRDRYARASSCEDAREGRRNGYCETTVKTTAGPVSVARPKLRGTTEVFASRLFGAGVTKTNALESLVIAGFVRGLSTRDVEAALAEALGEQATVSRSTVSRICAEIKDQFDAWRTRRLDDVQLDYLFLDGSHFRYHPARPRSRCWPSGASTPPASRCSSGWTPPPRSPPTPGTGSSPTSARGGWPARCWSSPTALPGCCPRWSRPWPRRCDNAA